MNKILANESRDSDRLLLAGEGRDSDSEINTG